MKRSPLLRRSCLRAVSPRRASQTRFYRRLRAAFLEAHPTCQARLPGCTGAATEIHHRRGRVGALLTDSSHFLAACHLCHAHITTHPAEAYALGLSERRVT